jgi:rhodanese-related sulfurtransferase
MLNKLFGRTTPSGWQNITPGELQQRLTANEAWLIVDVRMPEEFANDGHLQNSRLLPLPYLQARSQELPKDKPIALICRSGNRSRVAAEQLAALGFTRVYNVSGGIIAWQRAGLPLGMPESQR